MLTSQYEQQKKHLRDEAKTLMEGNYSAQHLRGLTQENPGQLAALR